MSTFTFQNNFLPLFPPKLLKLQLNYSFYSIYFKILPSFYLNSKSPAQFPIIQLQFQLYFQLQPYLAQSFSYSPSSKSKTQKNKSLVKSAPPTPQFYDKHTSKLSKAFILNTQKLKHFKNSLSIPSPPPTKPIENLTKLSFNPSKHPAKSAPTPTPISTPTSTPIPKFLALISKTAKFFSPQNAFPSLPNEFSYPQRSQKSPKSTLKIRNCPKNGSNPEIALPIPNSNKTLEILFSSKSASFATNRSH
ncbi:hypothetical protein PPERSA_05261 [Pseudocohnilembus persalinus]|uniref:Uncharacterized protein n=1 Tax=Pseudocohnilembus persalinus TaxID=266149 RepID=A0A0V0QXJ0_PSEPJ|nr:hypothetical protein PPERSA_05261 [Pseudocohnilembus persalinus]|eukprot:KRX07097.1 hypothetical protein PPERSA_05261 [Pseudocohnilembus persalinus]